MLHKEWLKKVVEVAGLEPASEMIAARRLQA